jgi:hypothetical protein
VAGRALVVEAAAADLRDGSHRAIGLWRTFIAHAGMTPASIRSLSRDWSILGITNCKRKALAAREGAPPDVLVRKCIALQIA